MKKFVQTGDENVARQLTDLWLTHLSDVTEDAENVLNGATQLIEITLQGSGQGAESYWRAADGKIWYTFDGNAILCLLAEEELVSRIEAIFA